jgi:hypothetical protein
MKQHLSGNQLKELSYENRISLLSLVVGLNKEYLQEEYSRGMKNEDAMLLEYGYRVNLGELMEIIQNYTGKFPVPTVDTDKYSLNITWKNEDEKIFTSSVEGKSEYIDALYEVVKDLFAKNQIVLL